MAEEVIRNLRFDGTDKLAFYRYKRQLLACGGIKGGFDEALLRSLSIANPLAQRYEDNLKKRKLALSHLYLTLDGAPLALVETQTDDDPSVAWTALCARYKPTTVDAYTQITREMENCTLENPDEDPEPWMQRLDRLNMRLATIGGPSVDYSKNEIQMIDHIIKKLPVMNYRHFTTVYGIGGMSGLALTDFQEKVHTYWRNNIKNNKSETEVSMHMRRETQQDSGRSHYQPYRHGSTNSDHQEFIEMFQAFMNIKKGEAYAANLQGRAPECTNCGRRGHLKEQCWTEGGGLAGKRPPIETVRCKRCGEMGHYQSQCKATSNHAHFFNSTEEDNDEDEAASDDDFEALFVATVDQVSHLSGDSKNNCRYEWVETPEHVKKKTLSPSKIILGEMYVGAFNIRYLSNMEDDKSLGNSSAHGLEVYHPETIGEDSNDDQTLDLDASDSGEEYSTDDKTWNEPGLEVYNPENIGEDSTDKQTLDLDASSSEEEYSTDEDEESLRLNRQRKIESDLDLDFHFHINTHDDEDEEEIDFQPVNHVSCLWNDEEIEQLVFTDDETEYGDEDLQVKMTQLDASTECQDYLIDSGATCHVTNDDTGMINVRQVDGVITVAENSTCRTNKCGTLVLQVQGLPSDRKILLQNVYHVKEFSKKIISVKRLAIQGYEMVFKNTLCEVHFPKAGILKITNDADGLFYIKATALKEHHKVASVDDLTKRLQLLEESIEALGNHQIRAVQKGIDINIAHDKFGHISDKYIKKTLNGLGIGVTGTPSKCESCELSKAKHKVVKKATLVRAKIPGERLFVDTAGPYSKAINGTRYWVQVVDDHTRMGFCYFLKSKDQIGGGLEILLAKFKVYNYKTKYLRCDNAGENEAYVQEVMMRHGIQPEFTSTETPQFNGVAERRIVTLKLRGMAMMNAANLSSGTQGMLWPEAIRCANTLYNITRNAVSDDVPFKMFIGQEPKIYPHLIEFGRIGVVTDTGKIKANWKNKGHKVIMTGYATNKSSDTYRIYNPKTRKITERRDIKWLDWIRRPPAAGMDIFIQEDPDKDAKSPRNDSLTWLLDEYDDEDPSPKQKGGRILPTASLLPSSLATVPVPQQNPFPLAPDPVDTSTPEPVRELRRLAAEEARDIRRQLDTIEEHNSDGTSATKHTSNLSRKLPTRTQPERKAKKADQQVIHILKRPAQDIELVFDTTLLSNPNEPKTINKALKGPEGREWKDSAKSEFENFIS